MAPPTEPPSTMAPSTMAPPTEPPSTMQPPTEPPSTMAPSTEPPSTMAPPTEPPSTMAPPTEPPSTMAPPTEPPSTMAPLTPEGEFFFLVFSSYLCCFCCNCCMFCVINKIVNSKLRNRNEVVVKVTLGRWNVSVLRGYVIGREHSLIQGTNICPPESGRVCYRSLDMRLDISVVKKRMKLYLNFAPQWDLEKCMVYLHLDIYIKLVGVKFGLSL